MDECFCRRTVLPFWPFLLRAHPKWHRLVGIALIIIGILYRTALYRAHTDAAAMPFSTFARMDGIACDDLLAFVLDGKIPNLSRSKAFKTIWISAIVITAAAILCGWAMIFSPVLIGFGCIGVLAGFMCSGLRSNRWSICFEPLEYLGKISYGLYVFHSFVLTTAATLIPPTNNPTMAYCEGPGSDIHDHPRLDSIDGWSRPSFD